MPTKFRPAVTAAMLAAVVSACEPSHVTGTTSSTDEASLAVAKLPSWTVIDFAAPTFFQNGFSLHGMSSGGHLVGAGRVNGFTQGAVALPNGGYENLYPLGGDVVTYPNSVNASGFAVGSSSANPQYESVAPVAWDLSGAAHVIPGLSHGPSEDAIAISDQNVVIGFTTRFVPDGSGYVWSPSWCEARQLANYVPEQHSTPTAINNRGQIVGVAGGTPSGAVAVTWDLRGRVTLLGGPATYETSAALGINDNGLVIGSASHPGDDSDVLWSWTRATGFQILPVPDGIGRAGLSGVDNSNRVYGWGLAADTVVQLIWVNRKPFRISPIHGGQPSGITALNGLLAGTVTVAGVEHPTVWVPNR